MKLGDLFHGFGIVPAVFGLAELFTGISIRTMERNSHQLADERLPHALLAENMAFTIAQIQQFLAEGASPGIRIMSAVDAAAKLLVDKAALFRRELVAEAQILSQRNVETAGNMQAALFLTAGAAVFPGVVIAVMITRSITSGESRLPSGTGTRGTA